MANRRETVSEEPKRSRRPATTPEARENQLISLAVDLVEKRLREGTASAQETVHFLKLGSSREKLEQARLKRENELLQAKTQAMGSAEELKAMYEDAMKAFATYSGRTPGASADEFEG